jgi:hypothetical protein
MGAQFKTVTVLFWLDWAIWISPSCRRIWWQLLQMSRFLVMMSRSLFRRETSGFFKF